MSVLVTSGAGYVGSHMVRELLGHGERVVVIENLSTGFRWDAPAQAELMVGDFGDKSLVTPRLTIFGSSKAIPSIGLRSRKTSVFAPEASE